jgi:uncharacterized protein with NRDE domain
MCTLVLAWRLDRRWPIVVAANRDERLGRPAEGWALRELPGGGRMAAPRDVLAGGTWIGLSARGVFAALTNYHAPLAWYPDPARRSRGELVGLALAARSAAAAKEALPRAEAQRWNPFHLVVADARDAFLWWYDGEASRTVDLAPGLHVVTERSPEGACPRGDLVRARWPLDPTLPRLRELLTVHEPPPESATCIHRDPQYGTRSSAVLRLGAEVSSAELYAADARPCVAPLEDRSDVLAALGRTAPPAP